MQNFAREEHLEIIRDKYIAFKTLISENEKTLGRIDQEFKSATELKENPIYLDNIKKIKQHEEIKALFQKLISTHNLEIDSYQQPSENRLLNIRNVLSLATYSAEIEKNLLLGVDQDCLNEFDQKINKLLKDGHRFLIEPDIDLFVDIHSHLVSLSIFCASIGAHLLWYATLSQTALFAAMMFIAITAALLCFLFVFRYQNAQKSKESVSDILFEIFEKLRNNKLIFTSEDRSEIYILLLKQDAQQLSDTDQTAQRDYSFWLGRDRQKNDGETITSEELEKQLKNYRIYPIRENSNEDFSPHSPDRSESLSRLLSGSELNGDRSQSSNSYLQASFQLPGGAEPPYLNVNADFGWDAPSSDGSNSFVVLKNQNSKLVANSSSTRPIESDLNPNNIEEKSEISFISSTTRYQQGSQLASVVYTRISDLSNPDTAASDYNMLEVEQPISPIKKWTQIGGLGFFTTSLVLGRTVLASSNQSMLIAAVGSTSHVAFLGMLTSMCVLPLFLMGQFLIDKSLPAHSLMKDVSYALLYVFNLVLSIKIMMYLAFMMSCPIMNMFALYSMVGTGIVPFLALGIALIYTFDSYQKLNTDHQQLEESTFSLNPG